MFTFNLYSSLLLPAVIQCVLFAVLTAWRYFNEKRQSDLFLALLLLFTGIKLSFWMLGFAGWYDSHNGYTTFMFYFPFNAYLLTGPLTYFYFLSLVNGNFQIGLKQWPHLIMPILFIVLMIGKFALDFSLYYPFLRTPDYQFGTRGPFAEADKSLPVTLLGFASFFFYLFLTLRSFPVYRKYVQENFSDSAELDFSWLHSMILVLSLGVMILFGFKLFELLHGGITYKTDWYGYAALAILSYYIGNKGYYTHSRQLYQLNFQPGAIPLTIETEINREDFDEDVWLKAVDELMQNGKPYLQPELSLTDLAAMLNTNKSVISRVINNYHQQNFNDFINRYRTNEVLALLKTKKYHQLTLLGIAYDCGFNSKATFNRAFKKVTGQTPREFIREQESLAE